MHQVSVPGWSSRKHWPKLPLLPNATAALTTETETGKASFPCNKRASESYTNKHVLKLTERTVSVSILPQGYCCPQMQEGWLPPQGSPGSPTSSGDFLPLFWQEALYKLASTSKLLPGVKPSLREAPALSPAALQISTGIHSVETKRREHLSAWQREQALHPGEIKISLKIRPDQSLQQCLIATDAI